MINQLAQHHSYLDAIMLFFSQIVPYIFMIILALVFFYGLFKRNKEALLAFINTVILTVINLIIGFVIGKLFFENRPFVTHSVHLLYNHISDASFPSDHALGTFSIALGIYMFRKKLGVLLMFLSFIVGFSRIYVGQHYPFDIIGAYLICLISFLLYFHYISNTISHYYSKFAKKIEHLIRF